MPAFCCTHCSTIYFKYILVIFLMVMVYAYMCDIKGEIQGCNVAIMLRITNFICKQPIRCVL